MNDLKRSVVALPEENESASMKRRSAGSIAILLAVAAFYICVMVFTNAHFMADSPGYVVSILAYHGASEYVVENPVVRDYRSENPFWDFGHLLWRPLGLLLFYIFGPLSRLVMGTDPALNVFFLLMCVNFLAGLLSSLLLYGLMVTFTGRRSIAFYVTIGFIISHGFLNFTQTGSSYVTGLAFLIAGLYLVLREGDITQGTSVVAGLLFALSVTMWSLYVLVIPAVVAAPLLLFGANRRQTRSVVLTSGTCILVIAIIYIVIMAGIGVHSPRDLHDWIAASSHGVRTSGLTRMLFGFPRSLIHMGNDGVLFKRFLLHDPFNPVSAVDLVRLSIWKLMLFYVALGSILSALLLSSARRVLALLALAAIPVIFFAILFDGGAVERYLPLYPFIFLSVAWTLGSRRVPRALKVLPVLFFCFAFLVNVSAMSRTLLERKQQRMVERLEQVLPQLKPNSWIVTTHLQDELVNFHASFPFHPINSHNTYRIYPLVNLNSVQAPKWREEFALRVLEAWQIGGDAWLSSRLLSDSPQADWNWVEGDDPKVSWRDIYTYFAQLEKGPVAGALDGFVRVERSDANTQFLKDTIQKHQLSFVASSLSIRSSS